MARDTLQIVVSAGSREGQKILTLKGSLNIQTIFDFQKATREEGAPKLILDFSGVPYMDSAGMGAIINYYVSTKRRGQKVIAAGVSERVLELFKLTKVDALIPLAPSIEQAEAAL